MKSARDLERELFQSALGAEFATSVSPPEIVIPIGDDGTIDEVASPDDNLQAVFRYLVKQ